ncbi:alkaline ceramidase 3-like [Ptychodera flava]|uniref:alkaline ceramidase 3-like n=1 Tax=Ptychodera flava TaxID=63121 RepID=UPI00396AAC06
MAPSSVGYWGPTTSTLDWCEENYFVTPYIAEFWNTVSNLCMILPPFIAIIHALIDGLERRYIASYLSLLVVGVGSWFFHMTLLYEMQLFDEIPMIWGSCVFLYCMIESHSPPKSHNYKLVLLLTFYAVVVTVVYVYVKWPIFHQIAYGILVLWLAYTGVRLAFFKGSSSSKPLLLISGFVYFMGFVVWNIDNIYCKDIRTLRSNLIGPLRPVTQLHAWWHVFAGFGTLICVMFSVHVRYRHLKYKCQIKRLGLLPCLRVDGKEDV